MSYYFNPFAKLFLRFALFSGLVLGIAYLPQMTLAQQSQNDTTKATDILVQVNAWRIDNGLWPLATNPTLDALALAQANYVQPFVLTIDDNQEELFHLDAKQRNPRDRAAAAGWPSYNNPAQIEVGENAGVGSAKSVMNFWRGSAIHAKAALSTTYREVGVAALPMKGGGYFYIMDFGARPDVLPVVVNADGKHLWLTEEKSRYAKQVKALVKVRLLDASGNPLTDIANWSPSIAIPDGVSTDNLQVEYISGDNTITTALNRGPFTTGPAAIPTSVVAAPTATPGVAAANPTGIPSTRAPDVTATIPASTPAPTVVAAIPTVDPAKADILLTYDADELFLRNVSKKSIDLTGLSLIGSGVTVGTPLWLKLADFPVDAFPPSNCLAAQLSTADIAIPSACKWTRSIINLNAPKLFWTLGDFIVSFNGTQVAACKPSDGQCAIDLP